MYPQHFSHPQNDRYFSFSSFEINIIYSILHAENNHLSLYYWSFRLTSKFCAFNKQLVIDVNGKSYISRELISYSWKRMGTRMSFLITSLSASLLKFGSRTINYLEFHIIELYPISRNIYQYKARFTAQLFS